MMRVIQDTIKEGFTIVEIIVVISVIGILAAISVVSYGAWQKNMAEGAIKSDLTQVAAAMEDARNFSNGYPLSIPPLFEASDSVALSYAQGDIASYCIAGSDKSQTSIKFYITPGNKEPKAGDCPPVVTNLVLNPSLEAGVTSYISGYFSAPMTVDSGVSVSGTSSLRVNTNSSIHNQGSIWQFSAALANKKYTCSISLKSDPNMNVAISGRSARVDGGYSGEGYGGEVASLNGEWQRFSVTFTSPASDVGKLYLQVRSEGAIPGRIIWADATMCTEGDREYEYADGNTGYGWMWSGEKNLSSSTGQAM